MNVKAIAAVCKPESPCWTSNCTMGNIWSFRYILIPNKRLFIANEGGYESETVCGHSDAVTAGQWAGSLFSMAIPEGRTDLQPETD